MRLAHVLAVVLVPVAMVACDLDHGAADAPEVMDAWADSGEVLPSYVYLGYAEPSVAEDPDHAAELDASLDRMRRHGSPDVDEAAPDVASPRDVADEPELPASVASTPAETGRDAKLLIRGLEYEDGDPRQAMGSDKPESVAPDGQWLGLVSKGRVLITDYDDEDFGPARFTVRRKYRKYVARKAPTTKALGGSLALWIGRPLEARDAKGGTCRGTVTDLYAEAAVVIGSRRARDWKGALNEESRHMASPQDVFEFASANVWGTVKWSSRRCAREAVVARTAGAPMPTVFVSDKEAYDRDGYLVDAHYQWSPEWALMQERFERERHGHMLRRVWSDNKVSSAVYRSGDTRMAVATAGIEEEGCDSDIGGESMGMLMSIQGDVVTTLDRWGAMHDWLPDLLLHFPASKGWVGLTVNESLSRMGLGGAERYGPEVMEPAFDCGC